MSANSHSLWIAREFGDPAYVPLTPADLEALDRAITVQELGSGARLYREGELADACFVVRSGEVTLVREAVEPTIMLSKAQPGQMIGDYAMFSEGVHATSAVANGPVTALHMSRAEVVDLLALHPRIGVRWMTQTLKRLSSAHERLAVVLSGSIQKRIAAYILSSTDDGEVEITHAGLGEMVGAGRASVTRAIGRLRSEGFISNGRGSIDIHDREGLERLLTQPTTVDAPSD